MNEDNMGLQLPAAVSEPDPDPGNSDPDIFTREFTAEELADVNASIEGAIQTLPVDNEGVL